MDALIELIWQRPASAQDRDALLAFIGKLQGDFTTAGEEEPELKAWTLACHALFASSRFQILE